MLPSGVKSTHVNPHIPTQTFKGDYVAIGSHQADYPIYLRLDVLFGDVA